MSCPEGTACAFVVSFDFDAEEVWIAEDPANASRPGVLSQGLYGAKVGVPLILRMLETLGMPATFFVPGRVAEQHPDRVRQILAAGHEVGLHGHSHRSPADMSRDEELKELRLSLRTLRGLGADPVGYRSPSWDFSSCTLDLLQGAGLLYSSNFMDDIRPYRHAGRRIVELPVHWSLDDAPHFWFDAASWDRKIATPSEVREIWQAEFEGIRALGGVCVLTLHPQICARPGRLAMVREFLRSVMGRTDVWVAAAREVARHADEILPSDVDGSSGKPWPSRVR